MTFANYSIPAGGFVVNKFGRTTNADTGVITDVWDGANATTDQDIWLAPTAPRVHSIVSTSDEDKPGGTGSEHVFIEGLTAWDGKYVRERIALNGVTPVNTINSYVIIHRALDFDDVNVGRIDITAATDSTLTAQIAAGGGQTEMAIFGVPRGRTMYLTDISASVLRGGAGAYAAVRLVVNTTPDIQTTAFRIQKRINTAVDGATFVETFFNPYSAVKGPCIIKMQAISSAANAEVVAGFDGVVARNSDTSSLVDLPLGGSVTF